MTGSIAFDLSTDIIYVAGTVNGVETIFSQDEANPVRWRAEVEVAKDGLYDIAIEMYDEAGNKSTYENVIEYILPWFVYDRTQADAERVKALAATGWDAMSAEERSEWMAGMKGAFNKADIKRIENNCSIIAQLLNIPMLTYKDNLPEFPTVKYFSDMLQNVSAIREAGTVNKNTPAVPDMPVNTWQKLNAVEQILHDVYMNYHSDFGYYAGEELYAGELVGTI